MGFPKYNFCSQVEQMKPNIEYKIIREIEKEPCQTQRGLAKKLNVSLGKANYVLAGLVEKGIIKAKKLKNQPGQIRWQYLLTPKGVKEKIVITQGYLNNRLDEFDKLQQEITELKKAVGDISPLSKHP
ncbi:MAG: MarR family EPS-associated transcriptional regulator [Chitinivibrionales bacterium]|nr:MarR family EPS-associated transcriptional regulator [Chitinivibrionales bacterium]